jgi:hypothetical protein
MLASARQFVFSASSCSTFFGGCRCCRTSTKRNGNYLCHSGARQIVIVGERWLYRYLCNLFHRRSCHATSQRGQVCAWHICKTRVYRHRFLEAFLAYWRAFHLQFVWQLQRTDDLMRPQQSSVSTSIFDRYPRFQFSNRFAICLVGVLTFESV